MIIQVTAEDIQNGRPRTMNCCPVALACQRQWRGDVKAGYNSFWFHTDGDDIPGPDTPREVAHWMVNFDVGGIVEPFSFEVNLDQ